jgi:Tfp pilus assembly protein PilV
MNTERSINHQNKSGQEGFAILEAMISMAIFAIGIFGLLSLQTASVRTNDLARGITTQSAMAAEYVEQLISLPYGHDALKAGNHGPEDRERYTISWTVVDNDMINRTKTITATVVWFERGVQKTIVLTYIKPDTI